MLGVIGLFMPVLQGWLFIIAGLSVMAPESPRAHRALEWVKARLPGRKDPHASPDGDDSMSSGTRLKVDSQTREGGQG